MVGEIKLTRYFGGEKAAGMYVIIEKVNLFFTNRFQVPLSGGTDGK